MHFEAVEKLGVRRSCRSCQHCSSASASLGWCRLRRLDVHPEVAGLVVCHHWTPCAPELPSLQRVDGRDRDQQLELDRDLVSSPTGEIG